ncbi:MAG: extracellular solute-binding protein [Betaproteobacteria bacterium]|nr:extracellular solute-binding protein [Betaproteobacteria bacterium]
MMQTPRKNNWTVRRLLAAIAAATAAASAPAAEVNLYTDRQEVFLRGVAAAYEKQSGDKVRALFVKKGLLERVKAEGDASPADVFLLADIGRLAEFVENGLTAPVRDGEIYAALPENLRAADGHWFAVTRRARVLYAAPGASIKTYGDLAKPKYKGVCMRRGAHPYNNALFADLAARMGRAAAKKWLLGVKNNLARKPRGKDRAQINAVANGECKTAVANSYYYFHLINNAGAARKTLLREKVAMIVPQDAHINITGMALSRRAPNPEAAARFMRFLIGETAQRILAAENFEFPARRGAEYPAALELYREQIDAAAPLLAKTAKWRKTAAELVDETGFDR